MDSLARVAQGLPVAVLAVAWLISCSPPAPEDVAWEQGAVPQGNWYINRFAGEERKWQLGDGRFIKQQARPAMLIYELTMFPGGRTTAEQQRRADALIEASRRAAEQNGWYDYDTGIASGYELQFNDEAHYVNAEYLFDDGLLDPERPEFLMYYDTSVGKRLVGFMYYATRARARGPQVGGPLTTWHFHVWSTARCMVRGLHAVALPDSTGECARGKPHWRSPEMLHVWLVEHPEGPFATRMRIDPQLLERLVEQRGY